MIAVTPFRPDVSILRQQFNALALDLTRADAELESAQDREQRPTSGWDTRFMDFAMRLDDVRMGFAQLRPDATDVIIDLGMDIRKIAAASAKLELMQDFQLSFKSGWEFVLDHSIDDVQRAAAMLDMAPPMPIPPVTPPAPGEPSYIADVRHAAELVNQSLAAIRQIPEGDTGDASTKDARIGAFKINKEAQLLLEGHFHDADQNLVSELRHADASLEDASWQLAKKPSEDGRFNGVDIPGAARDTAAAADILGALIASPS